MSELKLTGKVIAIMEKQQVTDTFAKREFVIETEGEYPETVKFELTQAKCDLIDSYKVGQSINVYFNVRGRKWTNKQNEDVYFVSLNAWRIEKEADAPEDSAPFADADPPVDSFSDSLPF